MTLTWASVDVELSRLRLRRRWRSITCCPPRPSVRTNADANARDRCRTVSVSPGDQLGPPAGSCRAIADIAALRPRVGLRRTCPAPIEAYSGRETTIALRESRCFPRIQCALMRAFRLDNDHAARDSDAGVVISREPTRVASFSPIPPSHLSPTLALCSDGCWHIALDFCCPSTNAAVRSTLIHAESVKHAVWLHNAPSGRHHYIHLYSLKW